MYDLVTCSNFVTKPRLCEIFSNLWHLRAVFTSLLLWEFFHDKIYNLHILREFGDEICLSNVIMHEG